MMRIRTAHCASAAILILALASSVVAQQPAVSTAASWPQRSVRFLVSLGPGSGADIGARLLADRLSGRWNQPVVVENRPGGDAVVAITTFISARDDHTLLYTPTSSYTAHPFQHDKLPYDPRELSPIARISNTLVALVVPMSLNVNTVADFIAMVRREPGKLNYSTATGMTDVIYDGYFKSAGLSITRVPYRDVVRSQSTRQLLVNLMVGLVEPEAVEGASPRNELREEADVAADLKIFPREPAVRGHELRVLVLSAHARR